MPVPKIPLQMLGVLEPYHLAWWTRQLRRRSILTAWNHRRSAIFVHIPKTAGTTMLDALGVGPVFDTHAPAISYREADPRLFARAFKFAVVRNPWDRFASTFHFLKNETDWPMQQQWAARHIGDLDFAGFVAKLRHPMFRQVVLSERFFWPQRFWITDRDGTTMIDEVYRFEQLGEALPVIAARLGIDLPPIVPMRRQSRRASMQDLYRDQGMIDLVAGLYAQDIAQFGYQFALEPA